MRKCNYWIGNAQKEKRSTHVDLVPLIQTTITTFFRTLIAIKLINLIKFDVTRGCFQTFCLASRLSVRVTSIKRV